MSISRINTNVQSMQAFNTLQKTNDQIGMRQLRLATGSRINRAEDDSAGYSIAKKLETKVRGQAQALSNIGDAKNMLTVGEGALNSTMDILQTMKEKAVQAANDTLGSDERAAIQSQLDELTKEIGDTLDSAEFNGKALFGGAETLSDGTTGEKLSFQVGAASSDAFEVEIGALGTNSLAKTATVSGTNAAAVGEASFNGDADASGTFAFAAGTNSGFKLTYNDGSTTVDLADDVAAADYAGQSFTTADGISVTIADDFAPAATETFDVAGKASAALSLDVSSSSNAQSAISMIDSAIAKVTDQVSSIGDAQSRLSFKSDNLQTNMTNSEASRSQIADADFAKEQMEIAKLQILQQTGTASLAQANAAPQSVLSLF